MLNYATLRHPAAVKRIVAGFAGFRFFRNCSFHSAIYVPFYIQLGAELSTLGAIQGTYWLVFAVAEVPLGFFADRCGRRLSVVLGAVIGVFSFLLLSQCTEVWHLFACTILMAIGRSLSSGADSALVSTALQKAEAASCFPQVESIGWMARNAALAISLAAGSLATLYLRIDQIIFLSGLVVVPSILFPLLIAENKNPAAADTTIKLAMLRISREPNRKEIAWLMALLIALSIPEVTGAWLIQIVMEGVGIKLEWFGLIYGATLLISISSYWIERGVSRIRRAIVIGLLFALGVIFFSASSMAMSLAGSSGLVLMGLAFVAYGILQGVYFPRIRAWLTECTGDAHRATILSLASLLSALGLALANVLVGALADALGAIIALGILGFLMFLLACLFVRSGLGSRQSEVWDGWDLAESRGKDAKNTAS